ncbi:uncharacterized protein LOC111400153 [Olea europaea var. sylvestris]|uniref:uncharacterized protein LOC111400153 n=1 Tax=Olea europaea var. sylvestris TaxID=158386 RepID=UPI000C1D12C7|nr:uncharacterized protein LOC111400153 [Olea europaea var. sylvestris]
MALSKPQGNGTLSWHCLSFLRDLFSLNLIILFSLRGLAVDSPSSREIVVCQCKYALEVLEDAGYLGLKPAKCLMLQNLRLTKGEEKLLDNSGMYRRLIGRLLHLTITRPDLSFSVQVMSQCLKSPRKPHLEAALHVLRYVKGTSGYRLLFPVESSLELKGFYDADWASCADTGRSVTSFCIFLESSLISLMRTL